MYHYGDIQKINGGNVPLVDVITFGSPCQDVSVAGKRAGMKHTDKGDDETTRSGLFFEAIRIIKEQRNECIRQLSMRRTNEPVRSCRYAIYENVPGALSSNKGEDFRCVLEEICKIADENATIPRPQGGAKWSYAGLIVGNKPHGTYSIAWRVHDLQYFGCPQRRRRLCVLADFDGDTAGKILFELQRETTDPETVKTFGDIGEEPRPEIQPFGESLSRNSEQGEQTGEESTTVTERNIGKAMSFQERAGRPGGGKGLLIQDEKTGALATHPQSVCASFYPQMKAESQCYREDDVANTIVNGTNPGFHNGVVVEDDKCLNGWDVQSKHIQPEEGKAETLYSGECRYGGGESYVMQKEPIAFEPGSSSRVGGHVYEDGKTGTIRANAGDNQQSVAYVQVETEVQVRKYPVDVPKLIECLQSHRAMKVGDIAEILNKPKTLVEHWFRKDKYFAIPDADIWFELKELLGIDTNEFDKSITTFETQPGKYDMNNRIHLGDVAPTQTANGENTMYCVPVENHPNDSRCKISEDGIVQTLSGRMGTGGNNTPMVLEETQRETYQKVTGTLSPGAKGGGFNGQDAYNDMLIIEEQPSTYGLDRASFNQGQNAQFDFSVEEELAPTIVSRGAGAVMSKKED